MAIEDLFAGTLIGYQVVRVLGKNHYNSVAKLRERFHLTIIIF